MECQWTAQDLGEPVFLHKNKLASHSRIVSTTRNKRGGKKASWTNYPLSVWRIFEMALFSWGIKPALILEANMSSHQYTLGHKKFSKTLLSRLESTTECLSFLENPIASTYLYLPKTQNKQNQPFSTTTQTNKCESFSLHHVGEELSSYRPHRKEHQRWGGVTSTCLLLDTHPSSQLAPMSSRV